MHWTADSDVTFKTTSSYLFLLCDEVVVKPNLNSSFHPGQLTEYVRTPIKSGESFFPTSHLNTRRLHQVTKIQNLFFLCPAVKTVILALMSSHIDCCNSITYRLL